jgi:ribosome recycling factor
MSECLLCQLSGSPEHPIIAETFNYINASVGKVHMKEISKQVCVSLNGALKAELTEADVVKHITRHTLDQRVVLNNMLRDLIKMADQIKKLSVVRDAESDAQVVDTKAFGAYLKAVDQITAIYKMECMRVGAK